MCGITGRINFDGRIMRPADVREAVRILKHRGPDAQNLLFFDTNAGTKGQVFDLNSEREDAGDLFFGHTRLSIIDLRGGGQPMTDITGKITVVFNGEIYNYIELRRELSKIGHEFRTLSDTEVILNAYREYGFDCLKHFNGMFAFAIYDSVKQLLFCARDRVGIKPFYYYRDAGKFIFASEIKSILSHPDIDREPDYAGVADYLTFLYTTQGKTFFKKIKSLSPGYTLTLGKGGMTLNRYWNPDLEPDYAMTEDYAVERLRFLVEDAVRLQIRSDVQVGANLSGGLDSSAIVGMASKYYDQPLFTFTGRFNEGSHYDESRYALAVASMVNARSHLITPTAKDLVDNIAAIAWHMDHPVVTPGLFSQFMVARTAGSMLKVVLAGQGGDEIFFGYPRYLRSIIETKLLNQKSEPFLDNYHYPGLMAYYIKNYRIPGLAGWCFKRRRSNFDRRYIMTSAPLYGLGKYFTGRLAEQLKLYSPFDEEIERFGKIETSSLINKMSWYDINNYLEALLHVEDRTSMAWSLESRVPLLDHRIVEFSFKIPAHIKLRNLKPKYIMKRAIEHVLPEIVKQRTDKKGFPTPIDIWFNRELADFANSFATPEIMSRRNFCNSAVLNRYFASKKRFLTPALRREALLWSIVNMELWFRSFVDDRSPERFSPLEIPAGVSGI